MKNHKNKGFTLIELLVVISVIGILAAMTLTGLASAQKSARDAQRKSDLNQYRVSLEGYYANNTAYPVGVDSTDGAGDGIFVATGPIINEFIPTLIDDPTEADIDCGPGATGNCAYNYNGTATEYVLFSRLETGQVWEICSNGKAGAVAAVPGGSNCTLP